MSEGCSHITACPITKGKVEWDAPCSKCGEMLHWEADYTGYSGIIEYSAIKPEA